MSDRRTQGEDHLVGRHLVIGLSGGIACYKIATLVSSLVQHGAVVDVLMTEAATRFIAPLTFESLTGRQVFDSQWKQGESCDPRHIQIATKAEAILIAPCTMNMLAKLSHGMTDDPVSLVVSAVDLAATPVLLAPSMNTTMYAQQATQRNLTTLSKDGYTIIDPEEGWQACRSTGQGRLPTTELLLESLVSCFS